VDTGHDGPGALGGSGGGDTGGGGGSEGGAAGSGDCGGSGGPCGMSAGGGGEGDGGGGDGAGATTVMLCSNQLMMLLFPVAEPTLILNVPYCPAGGVHVKAEGVPSYRNEAQPL